MQIFKNVSRRSPVLTADTFSDFVQIAQVDTLISLLRNQQEVLFVVLFAWRPSERVLESSCRWFILSNSVPLPDTESSVLLPASWRASDGFLHNFSIFRFVSPTTFGLLMGCIATSIHLVAR